MTHDGSSRAGRYEYAGVLVGQLIGAAGVLLIAARTWQTVTTPRPAPLPDDVLGLSGRTVDAAPTALALVALAGVVAVVATRGLPRRGIGALVALAGAGVVWRAVPAGGAIGAVRARSLVTDRHRTVDAAAVTPRIEVDALWPALTVACGALLVVAGAVVALRGHRWQGLSARYERPGPGDAVETGSERAHPQAQSPAAPTIWTALDRGDDPTVGDPGDDPASAPPDPPASPGRRCAGKAGYPEG